MIRASLFWGLLFSLGMVLVWCQENALQQVESNLSQVEEKVTLLEDQVVQEYESTKQEAVDRVNDIINRTLDDVEWSIQDEVQNNLNGIRDRISLPWGSEASSSQTPLPQNMSWSPQWAWQGSQWSSVASCLASKNIVLYAGEQCVYSHEQMKALGVQDRYDIVICQDNMALCTQAWVIGTPTRSVDGTLYTGIQTEEQLALAAGCAWN